MEEARIYEKREKTEGNMENNGKEEPRGKKNEVRMGKIRKRVREYTKGNYYNRQEEAKNTNIWKYLSQQEKDRKVMNPEEMESSAECWQSRELIDDTSVMVARTQANIENKENLDKEIKGKNKRKNTDSGVSDSEAQKKVKDEQKDKDGEIEDTTKSRLVNNTVSREENATWEVNKENDNKMDFYDWETCSGEYLITIMLKMTKMTTSKKNNLIKIYKIIMDSGIPFQSIRMVGFNKAEVTYRTQKDANEMLRRDKATPAEYTSYIPRRCKYRRGVIHEWVGSIQELRKDLSEKQGNFSLERLKKRRLLDGKAIWEDSKSILIKMQGDSLPTKLWIGYGHVWLNVQPFVESVKQCFKCLGFGHLQTYCRASEKKCFICAKAYHGKCAEKPFCNNCKGGHISTARECPKFQRESSIKKIMAFKNLSYKMAENIVRREERIMEFGYDREREREREFDNEDLMGQEFPLLPNTRKTEYWEKLDFPVQKEVGKWKRAMEFTKDFRKHKGDRQIDREEAFVDSRRPEQNKWGPANKVLVNSQDFNKQERREWRNRDIKKDNTRFKNEGRYKEDIVLQPSARNNNLDNEEETNYIREVSPLEYKTSHIQYEIGKQRNDERKIREECRERTKALKSRVEEELLDEIIKLIREKNLIKKLQDKLMENNVAPKKIEEEDDWNNNLDQPLERPMPKKGNYTGTKKKSRISISPGDGGHEEKEEMIKSSPENEKTTNMGEDPFFLSSGIDKKVIKEVRSHVEEEEDSKKLHTGKSRVRIREVTNVSIDIKGSGALNLNQSIANIDPKIVTEESLRDERKERDKMEIDDDKKEKDFESESESDTTLTEEWLEEADSDQKSETGKDLKIEREKEDSRRLQGIIIKTEK